MFYLGIVLFLGLVFMGVGALITYDEDGEYLSGILGGGLVWLFFALFLYVMPSATMYSEQIHSIAKIKAETREVALYQDRKDNLQDYITTELAKYPQYEQQLLGKLDPKIILSFPELKANTTILESVKQVVALNDEIYSRKADIIKLQGDLYEYSINPWTPHMFGPNYKHFIGSDNPTSSK